MKNPESEPAETERLDLWLCSARFFKTRSLAAEAVEKGKVDVNGERAKKARAVAAQDRITVRRGPYTTTVIVLQLARRRGPAAQAALMYEETAESRDSRNAVKVQLASMPQRLQGEGRPSKKDRRELRKLREDRD